MSDLLDHLRAARAALVLQLAESLGPERHLPDAGLLALLADLQGAIAAIEAVGDDA